VPFQAGETLVYTIAWKFVTAGEVRTSVRRAGGNNWQASIKATSGTFLTKLFPVDDSFISVFSPVSLCSHSLVKIVNEGKRHREVHLDFKPDQKLAALRERDLNNGRQVKQVENPIPACAYDLVSAIYYVRSLPLQVGRGYDLNLNDGGKTMPITVQVQAREDVKTAAGTFHAIRVEPRAKSGELFRKGGHVQVWLSDDPQRYLLKLSASVAVGSIDATLARIERK